jgi:hypothetical protein
MEFREALQPYRLNNEPAPGETTTEIQLSHGEKKRRNPVKY